MTKIEDFATEATKNNAKAVQQGIEELRALLAQIGASVTFGHRSVSRVQAFKACQTCLAMAIAADGRQNMVEDMRANAAKLAEPVDPRAAAVLAALDDLPLSRYSEDECDDTQDDTDDGLDDPPSCEETRRPWSKAPVTPPPSGQTVILPPEPTAEQRRQLERFFANL